MMSSAVTGPMPSIVSSCSTVAVPRLIGPSSAAAAGAAPAGSDPGRDDHLLAVGELRRQVDRVHVRRAGRAPGALDRIGDAGAGGKLVDAGLLDLAGDVDHHPTAAAVELERTAGARGLDPAERARLSVVGLCRAQPARAKQQQSDGDGRVDDQLRSAQLGHAAIVRDRGARVARAVSSNGYRIVKPSSPAGSASVTSTRSTVGALRSAPAELEQALDRVGLALEHAPRPCRRRGWTPSPRRPPRARAGGWYRERRRPGRARGRPRDGRSARRRRDHS